MQANDLKRIAVHSVPRSGSTWLGAIFDSSPNVAFRFQPLFSYSHKGRINERSTKDEISSFFREILYSNDAFVLQFESKRDGLIPSFAKSKLTHVVYKEVRYHHILSNLLRHDDEIKLVGLIRNPLAVIHSWLNAPKEFRRNLGWKELDEWKFAPKKNMGRPEEFNGYAKWKEAVMIFESLYAIYPERVRIVNYGELLNYTIATVQNLFDFCGLSMNEQTLRFIEEGRLTRNDSHPYSVYKVKEADNLWQEGLSESIKHEILYDIQGTIFEKYF